jgi:hypothetical protein
LANETAGVVRFGRKGKHVSHARCVLAAEVVVLLYDAAGPPEPVVRPIVTDPAAHNPFGVRSAK